MSIFNKQALDTIELETSDVEKHAILILVVDDEAHTRHTLRDMLSPYYRVLTADDGQTALELIQHHPNPNEIHLILCDQRMPKLNGVDFLEKTLAIIPDAVRMILTAYTDMESVVASINRAQIHKFILKPFEKDELLMNIKRALETYELRRKNREHERTEEVLRESEAQFRSMFENHSSIMFLIDPKTGQIIKMNEAAKAYYGYSSEELTHLTIYQLNQLSWEEIDTLMMEAKIQKKNYFSFKHRLASGEIRDVEVHSSPIPFKGKNLLCSIVHDITDRKRMEQELRDIEWLLTRKVAHDTVKHQIPYGNLYMLNSCRLILDSVEENVLFDIAEDYLDLIDTSTAIYEKNGDYALGIFASGWCQFMDQASRNLCHTEDNRIALASGKWLCHESCWTDCSKVVIETGEPIDIECNGGIRLYGIPIRVDGKVIGSMNFGYGNPPNDPKNLSEIAKRYNVTIEKLMEQANAYQKRPSYMIEIAKKRIAASARLIGEIVKNRQIEKDLKDAKEAADLANRSKSAFLANMSHEIRTPMNAIIGSSKILIEMNSTNEQKKYLNIIKAAGKNLLSIINDILDLSKIEAGKIDIEYKDTTISDILNNVQNIIYPLALSKGIEFLCAKENKNFPVIKADGTRLKQILLNLVNNAIKFTFQGLVSINVSIDNETDTHITLRFTVKDTGIGIQQDKINQLFQPFSQVSKIKAGGTGLGLTISKKLVELMKGTIHVESDEDKRSKFWFVIPFEKGSLSTVQRGESIQDTHKNIQKDLKILVAEDNIFNQEVIQGLLKKHKVTVVSNGREAIEVLENNFFDVILMDIQMPEMDGITATKMIRNQNSKVLNHDIPIIAMTAYAMKEDRDLCLQSGMNGYVAKPIDLKKLTQEIERLLIPQSSQIKSHDSLDHHADLSKKVIFDLSNLLMAMDNNKVLALGLTKKFLDVYGYSKYLSEIKHAIDEKNAEKLQNKAHTLKGMIGYFSSSGKELTSKLQEMGRIKDLSKANETYESLTELISNLTPLLENFIRDLEKGEL